MNQEIKSISLGDITIIPDKNVMIAGPCAVESENQMDCIAQAVVAMGADFIRGGAYKPRSNPESFQGLGELGLRHLFESGKELNVPVVTEVMEISQIEVIKRVSHGHPYILQIGSRNAQNYSLLEAVGKTGIPVLLKRGKGSSVDEMLGSAQYVTKGGSPVLMCERGIVSFSSGDPKKNTGRFTADHLAIIKFQEAGFLTVFDPSHAAGLSDHVIPLALSGIAIGANGLIVEVHNNPSEALCDKDQALTFPQFQGLIHKARKVESILRSSV